MKLRALCLPVLLMLCMFACPANAAQHSVLIKWTPSTAGTGVTITGYKIYRGTTPGGELTAPLTTVTGASSSQFTDSAVVAGTTYYYQMTTTGTCDSTLVDCTGFTGESAKTAEFKTDKAIPLDPAQPLSPPTAATAVVQ